MQTPGDSMDACCMQPSWWPQDGDTYAFSCLLHPSRRMLHRDVKTLNIFLSGPLDQPGQPPSIKLGDVGEAKECSSGACRPWSWG